ncbi:hypothetical protein SDC9_97213 [bioreactor metagenome]|uniref:Uncharacterized protein n=1 Tax=bioreactor metagenome TaxID=1076179 RepID=A0A645ABA8_9ZZZZ
MLASPPFCAPMNWPKAPFSLTRTRIAVCMRRRTNPPKCFWKSTSLMALATSTRGGRRQRTGCSLLKAAGNGHPTSIRRFARLGIRLEVLTERGLGLRTARPEVRIQYSIPDSPVRSVSVRWMTRRKPRRCCSH